MSIRREINEYLFNEFGLNSTADESAVTDDWPFVLEAVGSIDVPTYLEIFRFYDGEDAYYATGGARLRFFPSAGMELNDLKSEALGIRWIAEREPVDLNTVRLGDPEVPPLPERRTAIERLAKAALPAADGYTVTEGLFLQKTGEYLALISDANSPGEAVLIGSGIPPRSVGFPQASRHRRVGWAVGQLVGEGVISL